MAIAAFPSDPGSAQGIWAALAKRQSDLNKVLAGEVANLIPDLTSHGGTEAPYFTTTWLSAILALIREYGMAYAALGGAAYTAYRDLILPGDRFTPPAIGPVDPHQVASSVAWATRTLTQDADAEVVQAATKAVAGSAQRLVTNQGRKALVQAVTEDDAAAGWYRVPTDADACAFCRLMSIRGPVYKNAQTAGKAANADFVGAGEFKFHDFCECIAAPYFPKQGWQVPVYVHEWDQQYTDATADNPADKLNAFRRVVEERD